MKRHGRVTALDGVRGLAVLLVTVSHAGFPLLKLGASTGVTLFFVLSGYLITGLLLDERHRTGRIDLPRFYRRRALRLLPALILLLVVWAPASLLLGRDPVDIAQGGISALFYFQNLSTLTHWSSGGIAHVWSLSLEEQFYIVWPALLLAVLRWGSRRSVIAVAAAGTALSLAARFVWTDWHTAAGYENAYYLPTSAVWALLTGVAVAAAVREWPRITTPRGTATVAVVGLLAASSVLGMTNGVAHAGLNYGPRLAAGPVAAAFSVALILAVTTRPPPAWIIDQRMLWFGAISYGLYLWHDTLTGLVETKTGHGNLTHILVASCTAVLAVGVAWASYRFVETPFLRLKDHDRVAARRPAVGPSGGVLRQGAGRAAAGTEGTPSEGSGSPATDD